MDLFNWYVDFLDATPHLCGDVCATKLRHEQFVMEMMAGYSHQQITKNDEQYKNENKKRISSNIASSGFLIVLPNDRHMSFIREPIKKIKSASIVTSKGEYILINMDRFFAKSRKMVDRMKQLGITVE